MATNGTIVRLVPTGSVIGLGRWKDSLPVDAIDRFEIAEHSDDEWNAIITFVSGKALTILHGNGWGQIDLEDRDGNAIDSDTFICFSSGRDWTVDDIVDGCDEIARCEF